VRGGSNVPPCQRASAGCKPILSGLKRSNELVPINQTSTGPPSGSGGLCKSAAATARHDAVRGAMRAACSDMGMDVIQKCESHRHPAKMAKSPASLPTGRTLIATSFVRVVAGHSGIWPDRAGFRLANRNPSRFRPGVRTDPNPAGCVIMRPNTVHGYMSQSDKGEDGDWPAAPMVQQNYTNVVIPITSKKTVRGLGWKPSRL